MFKCGFCGKEYNTLYERMQCEKNCYEKRLAEQKRQEEEKRKLETERSLAIKDQKLKLIQQKYNELINDITQFNKDYNESIKLDGEHYNLFDDDLFHSIFRWI